LAGDAVLPVRATRPAEPPRHRVQTRKSHAILFSPKPSNGGEQAQDKAGCLFEHWSQPGEGCGLNPKGAADFAPECSREASKMNHISFASRPVQRQNPLAQNV
jgi:hypothetical protein